MRVHTIGTLIFGFIRSPNWSPPLDLSPGDGEPGEVFVEEVLLGAHAEGIHILLPVEIADVKVKDSFVFLSHHGKELVVVGVGPLGSRV